MEQTIEKTATTNTITVPDELCQIAVLIRRQWTAMYFGAVPYVEAMLCLKTIDDNFGDDSGRSIVTYFLGNAKTWKGEYAKAVKAKLNELLKKEA
ncbi:hypothetical protein [Puia dinghuensis]|uniref:Uncharacterized protein n=1 Tax=Puia dinghuensis TaxID=1792502 RepID=A0A8J2UBT9_9BACT|nr:hypothetical protein [Puia dinghuensis]GGA92847.1 hypothetical protein GCM10011511_15310 [Puia dinghuensis]